MSEEFRRKLQLYEEGKLPAEEREEVEREIEKKWRLISLIWMSLWEKIGKQKPRPQIH